MVAQARNGREAVERFDETPVDVVFLDVQMPGLNGVEAARSLRGRTHLVFVTAFEQYALQAFEEGAIDYLVKPFEPARLAQTVQRLAAGRRLVLLSTAGERFYHRAVFEPDDILMLGSESAGVPEVVHRSADLRVRIPLRSGRRSLNVVTAAAIGLAEALRQTSTLPEGAP